MLTCVKAATFSACSLISLGRQRHQLDMVERDYQKQKYVDTVDFICTLLGRPCSSYEEACNNDAEDDACCVAA